MESNFLNPYIRFLNASPDKGRVSLFVNGESLFGDFAFGEISGYKRIPQGEVTLRAVWEGNGENVIYTLQMNVNRGDVQTIALCGGSGSRTLFRINDLAEKNKFKAANFRVANLVYDHGGFNIYANGFFIIEGVEYLDVSDYILLKPNVYRFKVNSAATGDTLLDTGNQNLEIKKYYTLYIIGSAENETVPVKAIFATDAATHDGEYL